MIKIYIYIYIFFFSLSEGQCESRRAYGQVRQFVFRSGGDNNHKLECGLKSAGYPYVSFSSIQHCITYNMLYSVLSGFENPI